VDGDVIRVRMLANWCSSGELRELFNRMTTEGNYEWCFSDLDGAERRLRVTAADDEEPDYWVVINAPPDESERFDRRRTVVFHMEPLMWTEQMRGRWNSWSAPSPLSFLQVRDHRRYRNSGDWWVGPSYAELRHGPPPRKHGTMAACVSTNYLNPGHIRRIDFLRFLDRQDIDLDIYGAPENGFRRWRSQPPRRDKRLALLPYRYCFDAENNAAPNYYTEKIVDCLLAETLCFYWGCPNLDSFVDPRAFIRLDLDDFEADFERVRRAIEADEWSARLPYIRAEKQRILDEHQFFPTLARIIDPARRRPRRHDGPANRSPVDAQIGERRCGSFVEISDRTGTTEAGETLDAERRLDWTGLCLESDPVRARWARGTRDCTVADDNGMELVEDALARNGLAPNAIEWLNLAVRRPHELIREGGRLDPERVRANLISMPLASDAERRLAAERLASLGYRPLPAGARRGVPIAMERAGRGDIFGFYHLCTVNTWREVADEHLRRWADSGLLHSTRRIFASVVGAAADEGVALLAAACGDRLEVVHQSPDPACSERPVLEYARRFCEEREPLAHACWYMHSAGVSEERCRNRDFVVERWQECIAALDHHDVCGLNWQLDPAPHFSGNLWWARPRYLSSLPARIGPGQFEHERWIGSNQPSVHCPRDNPIGRPPPD
jgi:hypothetical protein